MLSIRKLAGASRLSNGRTGVPRPEGFPRSRTASGLPRWGGGPSHFHRLPADLMKVWDRMNRIYRMDLPDEAGMGAVMVIGAFEALNRSSREGLNSVPRNAPIPARGTGRRAFAPAGRRSASPPFRQRICRFGSQLPPGGGTLFPARTLPWWNPPPLARRPLPPKRGILPRTPKGAPPRRETPLIAKQLVFTTFLNRQERQERQAPQKKDFAPLRGLRGSKRPATFPPPQRNSTAKTPRRKELAKAIFSSPLAKPLAASRLGGFFRMHK